jgi:hypothetical protein
MSALALLVACYGGAKRQPDRDKAIAKIQKPSVNRVVQGDVTLSKESLGFAPTS